VFFVGSVSHLFGLLLTSVSVVSLAHQRYVYLAAARSVLRLTALMGCNELLSGTDLCRVAYVILVRGRERMCVFLGFWVSGCL
jgi:hypothetical protein